MAKTGATSSRQALQERERYLASKTKGMAFPSSKGVSITGEVLMAGTGMELLSTIASIYEDIKGGPKAGAKEIDASAAKARAEGGDSFLKQKAPTNNTVVFRRIDAVESVNLAGMFLSGPPPAGAAISPESATGSLHAPFFKEAVAEAARVQKDLARYGNVSTAAGRLQLEKDALSGDKQARQTVRNINRS